jgi:hypothetical protein
MLSMHFNIRISIRHHYHYSHIKYHSSKSLTNWIVGSSAKRASLNHLPRQQAAQLVSAPDKEVNGASTVERIHIYDQAIECPVVIDALRTGMNGDLHRMATTCLTGLCHEIHHTMGIADLRPVDQMMGTLAKHYHTMTTSRRGPRQEPSIEGKAPQALHHTVKIDDRPGMRRPSGMNGHLEMTDHLITINVVLVVATAAVTSIPTFPHTQPHNPTKGVLPGETGIANNRQGGTMESEIGTATEIVIETGTEGETRMTAYLLLLQYNWRHLLRRYLPIQCWQEFLPLL